MSFINRQKVSTSRASSFFPKLEGVVDTKFKRNFSGTVGDKRETISKVQMSYSFNLGGTAINTLRQSKETASQWHSIYAESRNKTEESVRNAWDKLRTSQERVQILTDDISFAYYLRKKSCTQFYISAQIINGITEKKFISQLNKAAPNIILYKSQNKILLNYSNMPNATKYIEEKYKFLENFNGYIFYKLK